MALIQNTLLVIGATASGGVSGWFATYVVMSAMFEQPRGENFGGAAIWLVCMAGGATLMALVGLVGALYRIARNESRPWSPIVWLGIVLGVAVGLAVHFGSVDAFFQAASQPIAIMWYVWPGAVFVSGACGAVGGVLASLARRLVNRAGIS